MGKTIKWGIISTADITGMFLKSIKECADTEVVAVASRSLDKARQFAEKNGIAKAYGSYRELYADPEIDIVYICTPTGNHYADVSEAVAAGKHVMCEKPMASNAREIRELGEKARAANVFLMEAIWAAFTEKSLLAKKWIDEGKIGRPRLFTMNNSIDNKALDAWRWNAESGGGGLLDNGIYPVTFARLFFGKMPRKNSSFCMKHSDNIDLFVLSMLEFDDDQVATICGGLNLKGDYSVVVNGTKGMIKMPHPFWDTTALEYYESDPGDVVGYKPPVVVEVPDGGARFKYEITEACRCVSEGLLESPLMPNECSIEIATIMENIRKECGVVFSAD